jgi:hypothetical protein
MDGQEFKALVSYDLFHPVSLAVDYHMENRIFWTDNAWGIIASVNEHGQDRITLIKGMHASPMPPSTVHIHYAVVA